MASLDCGAFLCLKEEWFLQELRGGVIWNAGCPWRWTHVNADNVRRWPGTGQDGPSGHAEWGQPLLMLQGTQEPLWYIGWASTFSPPHFIIQKGTSFFNNQLFSLSCFFLKRKCRDPIDGQPSPHPPTPNKKSLWPRGNGLQYFSSCWKVFFGRKPCSSQTNPGLNLSLSTYYWRVSLGKLHTFFKPQSLDL